MVTPESFDVDYSINPWMNPNTKVNKAKARTQWKNLHTLLTDMGIKIDVMKGIQGLKDMVFAANAGWVDGNIFISSNFKDKERRPESRFFEERMRYNGFETYSLDGGLYWEGEACSLKIGENLIASYGLRARKDSYYRIAEIINLSVDNIIFIELIDPFFYHLDVAFCLLRKDLAIACPLAFRESDLDELKERTNITIIPVSYDDALNFACNGFVIKDQFVVNMGISEDLKGRMNELGIVVKEVDVSEFLKSGGGVKCMLFNVDGKQ